MKNFVSKLTLLCLVSIMTMFAGCAHRAVTNMQTLVSSDCGKSWELIQPGESIPRQIMPCDLRVSIPNYPMQGDANFKVNFKARVLVTVAVSYEYTINGPLEFIKNARYLGRQNSAADGTDNALGSYESAENMLIDRRIREVATTLLREEDIVIFDSSEFEDKLLEEVNKVLSPRGVTLNSIAFVPMPDPQTRQAIDVGAAMRVYQAIGLEDLGKELMVSKAGATVVSVTVPETKQAQAE